VYDAPTAKKFAYIAGAIQFVNVDFSYDSNKVILKDLNITFPGQSIYSVVGESGIGKSSIMSLIVNTNICLTP
jgi:ABC-type multidrug transport system fused ATPase/permease subunit